MTVMGRLADKPPRDGQALRGVLTVRGFEHSLLHPDDLPTFTKLHTGRITHRQVRGCAMPCARPPTTAVNVMFGCLPCASARAGRSAHGHVDHL